MGFSTNDPSKVGFSRGSRVFVGPENAPKELCTPVGLLGADATLAVNKTFRTKNDHFPSVAVAQAVNELTAQANFVLREWTRENLMLAFGLRSDDVTDTPGGSQSVAAEVVQISAGGMGTLQHPAVDVGTVVLTDDGTPLVLGDDYVLAQQSGRTLIVIVPGGAISPSSSITAAYDYTAVAHSSMPIGASGPVNYYGVWIEEEFTMSSTARTDYQLYRASIGLDGNISLNSAENGADLPVLIQASLAMGQSELGMLHNYA
jgi:hypothetical protein